MKNSNNSKTHAIRPPKFGTDKSISIVDMPLEPRQDQFWNSLGIYPKALSRLSTTNELIGDARAALLKLGKGNLRLLCEELRLAQLDDADERHLTQHLLSSVDKLTLFHLREFMRRRIEWIEAVFDSVFAAKAAGYQESVIRLSGSASEGLKPFTKLLLLYAESPDFLTDIYFQSNWYSKPTSFEYESSTPFSGDISQIVLEGSEFLTDSIKDALSGRGVSFAGRHSLASGVVIAQFLRAYSAVVRRDFHNEYNVHFGCGLIAFGIDASRGRVHVKCGNQKVANSVKAFVEDRTSCELRLLKNDVFSDFTASDVTAALLGRYPADKGIEIIGATFSRASFGNHGSLSLKAGFLQPSIRKELEFLDDLDLVEVNSPADLEQLSLTFRDKTVDVVTETVLEGAIRLRFENTGWTPQDQEAFEAAFKDAFRVPLNKLLDPSKLALGNIAVYAHLLAANTEDEVQPYQIEAYARLVESGLVKRSPQTAKKCKNCQCRNFTKVLFNASIEFCRECGTELADWSAVKIVRHPSGMTAVVKDFLERVNGWKLADTQRQFERYKYTPLQRDQDTIDSCAANRLPV